MAMASFYENGCNMPLFIVISFGGAGVSVAITDGINIVSIPFLVIAFLVLVTILIPLINKYRKIMKAIKTVESKRELYPEEKKLKDTVIKLLGVLSIFFI